MDDLIFFMKKNAVKERDAPMVEEALSAEALWHKIRHRSKYYYKMPDIAPCRRHLPLQ